MTDNLLKCIPFILPTKSSPTCYCSKGTGLASRRLLSPVSHSSRQGGCGCEEDFCRAESGITGFGLLVSGAHERLFTWRNSATHTLNLISYGIRVLQFPHTVRLSINWFWLKQTRKEPTFPILITNKLDAEVKVVCFLPRELQSCALKHSEQPICQTICVQYIKWC